MAFQFPASPTVGQVFDAMPGLTYTWNGTGWSPTGNAIAYPSLHPDGTLAAPGMSWVNEPAMGFWRPIAGHVGFVVGGTTYLTIGSTVFDIAPPANFYGQVRFSDGTINAPGISWISDPDTGIYRDASGNMHFSMSGMNKVTMDTAGNLVLGGFLHMEQFAPIYFKNAAGTLMNCIYSNDTAIVIGGDCAKVALTTVIGKWIDIDANGITLAAGGTNAAYLNVNGFGHHVFTLHGGTGGSLSNLNLLPLVIKSADSGATSGFSIADGVAGGWLMGIIGKNYALCMGAQNAAGPAALAGFAFNVAHDGVCYARSFNPATFAASDIRPMTGALDGVLKLRGMRCINTETGRPALRLEMEDVEQAFPELIAESRSPDGTSILGRGIDYMTLVAPIIEAIRELDARLKPLENSPLVAELTSRVKLLERQAVERRR